MVKNRDHGSARGKEGADCLGRHERCASVETVRVSKKEERTSCWVCQCRSVCFTNEAHAPPNSLCLYGRHLLSLFFTRLLELQRAKIWNSRASKRTPSGKATRKHERQRKASDHTNEHSLKSRMWFASLLCFIACLVTFRSFFFAGLSPPTHPRLQQDSLCSSRPSSFSRLDHLTRRASLAS